MFLVAAVDAVVDSVAEATLGIATSVLALGVGSGTLVLLWNNSFGDGALTADSRVLVVSVGTVGDAICKRCPSVNV